MPPIFSLAIPIALLWMAVTGHFTLGGALVGYLVGIAVLLLAGRIGVRPHRGLNMKQLLAAAFYAARLLKDIVFSSLQVARIILSPRTPLQTGILAIPSGDTRNDQLLTAMSAHGLNVSPGQMVIDIDDMGTLYVHCLDLEASRPTIEAEQRERLHLLKKVIGEPE